MNFLQVASVLESVREDLEYGLVEDAREKLGEVVRINPHDFYGTGPIHKPTRKAAAKMARNVRKKAVEPGRSQWWHQNLKAGMYAAAGAKKKARETFKKAQSHALHMHREDTAPTRLAFQSVAQSHKPEKKKPTPSKRQDQEPLKIKFKSLLKGWKEHCEGGGEDSPEALGGFLHRHLGHKNFPPDQIMEIVRRAHGKDKSTAQRAANHYEALQGKGKRPLP
jgi:hypothetical protein